jgi:hypothetical protein
MPTSTKTFTVQLDRQEAVALVDAVVTLTTNGTWFSPSVSNRAVLLEVATRLRERLDASEDRD